MKRYILALLCSVAICMSWGQLNNNCFKLPIPDDNSSIMYMSNQTYTNTTYHITEDSTIIALNNSEIYGLAISGEISLQTSRNSSVKVVLVDYYGTEYLIYEVNSLLTDTTNFTIENIGRETLWDYLVCASHIICRLQNATISISEISPITQILADSAPARKQARSKEQSNIIINTLNANLRAKEIPWVAGETEISEMEYNEKVNILGDNNPMHNIEYYIGGYYIDPAYDESLITKTTSNTPDQYIPEFDWRNRHGKNWITPVKYQDHCNSCGAFASLALLEAYAKIYFNDPNLNIDLSEQEILACLIGSCDNDGVFPMDVSKYIVDQHGIMGEKDYGYNIGIPISCDSKPLYPNEILAIDRKFYDYRYDTPNDLKELLFHMPFCFGKKSWIHVMLLVGYKTIEEGDIIYSTLVNSIYIPSNSKYIGATSWTCKNSWGYLWGDYGYLNFVTNMDDIYCTNYFYGGITYNNNNNNIHYDYDDVKIVDNDGDGYYNWGIGGRPLNAPSWVFNYLDGDDNNPALGQINQYGYCEEIGPEHNEPSLLDRNAVYAVPQFVQRDLIIPAGITLTITSHLVMHRDAKIIIAGGQVILDGGYIHNGYILNKGSFTIKNNGVVEMRSDGEFIHDPHEVEIVATDKEPFPIMFNMELGEFKHI